MREITAAEQRYHVGGSGLCLASDRAELLFDVQLFSVGVARPQPGRLTAGAAPSAPAVGTVAGILIYPVVSKGVQ